MDNLSNKIIKKDKSNLNKTLNINKTDQNTKSQNRIKYERDARFKAISLYKNCEKTKELIMNNSIEDNVLLINKFSISANQVAINTHNLPAVSNQIKSTPINLDHSSPSSSSAIFSICGEEIVSSHAPTSISPEGIPTMPPRPLLEAGLQNVVDGLRLVINPDQPFH